MFFTFHLIGDSMLAVYSPFLASPEIDYNKSTKAFHFFYHLCGKTNMMITCVTYFGFALD